MSDQRAFLLSTANYWPSQEMEHAVVVVSSPAELLDCVLRYAAYVARQRSPWAASSSIRLRCCCRQIGQWDDLVPSQIAMAHSDFAGFADVADYTCTTWWQQALERGVFLEEAWPTVQSLIRDSPLCTKLEE